MCANVIVLSPSLSRSAVALTFHAHSPRLPPWFPTPHGPPRQPLTCSLRLPGEPPATFARALRTHTFAENDPKHASRATVCWSSTCCPCCPHLFSLSSGSLCLQIFLSNDSNTKQFSLTRLYTMSPFFVVEPNNSQDHRRSGSSYAIKDASMALQSDLKKHAEQQPADVAKQKPYSLSMPPATPPRADSPTQKHQFASPSGSATTLDTSPASTSSGPSLASTGPSSAATSPVTQCSAFNPDSRQSSGRKCSFSTLQIVSTPSVKFTSKISNQSLDYSSPSTSASSSAASSPSIRPGIRRGSPDSNFHLNFTTLGSLLPTRNTYISPSPASFLKPPPLDPNVLTTFGPYKSPHTLSELHSLAWSNQPFPIESCLQCRHKNLPCPLTLTSPANAHLGPLLLNGNNNIVKPTAAPRPLAANPRFPACLRCIRAGEADCCIVQRRATLAEKEKIRPQIKTFAEAAMLDTAVVVLPTDRDVADPALFAAKMRRRDELLHQAELRESRTAFAPRKVTTMRDVISSDEEKIELRQERIRSEQERDRILLGGTGREEVLSPTENWGEKWVGRREWNRQDFTADAKGITDDTMKLVKTEIAIRRGAGLGEV